MQCFQVRLIQALELEDRWLRRIHVWNKLPKFMSRANRDAQTCLLLVIADLRGCFGLSEDFLREGNLSDWWNNVGREIKEQKNNFLGKFVLKESILVAKY